MPRKCENWTQSWSHGSHCQHSSAHQQSCSDDITNVVSELHLMANEILEVFSESLR